MKRFMVLVMLAATLVVAPQAASAAGSELSPGCRHLRNPGYDGNYQNQETAAIQLQQGEVVRIRAGRPAAGAAFVRLRVNGETVAESAFPGRANWAAPEDGSYRIGWDAGAGATWRVTCGPPTTPFAPEEVKAMSGDGATVLTWEAPLHAGGAPIDDYRIQYRTRRTARWITVPDGVSPSRTATVNGLTNGESYRFRVAAVNAFGRGPWSDPTPARIGTPSEPRMVDTEPGDGQIRVNWAAPAAEGAGPIFDYAVQYRLQGDTTWTPLRDGRSMIRHTYVEGLVNGETYEFRVTARNEYGRGPWSETVTGIPSA
jgi:hypothetical protein